MAQDDSRVRMGVLALVEDARRRDTKTLDPIGSFSCERYDIFSSGCCGDVMRIVREGCYDAPPIHRAVVPDVRESPAERFPCRNLSLYGVNKILRSRRVTMCDRTFCFPPVWSDSSA